MVVDSRFILLNKICFKRHARATKIVANDLEPVRLLALISLGCRKSAWIFVRNSIARQITKGTTTKGIIHSAVEFFRWLAIWLSNTIMGGIVFS